MGSGPCSKAGFLLFLLLQISLPSCVRGQTSDATTSFGTDVSAITDTPTFTATSSGSNFTSVISDNSTILTITNMTTTDNATVSSPGSNSTSKPLISCRVLTCNASQCLSAFQNTNATVCAATDRFCELRREDPMRYSVNCATTCLNFCNGSQINCSIECCGSEFCLNSTLANLTTAMMPMTSTTLPTSTNMTTKAATAVSTTTPANNGKKCHKITCSGDTCYQSNAIVMLCSPTQHYCMLKKTTSGTAVTWTAGCSEDCRKETACATTTANCFLECCNATTTASCLKMTGALNMPSSATRGLFSPMLLMVSSLLFWLLSMVTSA